MILMDSGTNHAMCFGHTVVVTETGCEVLSKRSLDLVVK
jgi:Xaa-Pro dipeptidase